MYVGLAISYLMIDHEGSGMLRREIDTDTKPALPLTELNGLHARYIHVFHNVTEVRSG